MAGRLSPEEYSQRYRLDAVLRNAGNACYAAQTDNPAVFLATHLRKTNAVEIIDSVSAREVLDGTGRKAVSVKLCVANGVSVTTQAAHSLNLTSTNPTPSRKASMVGEQRGDPLDDVLALVNNDVNRALRGMRVTQQEKIDAIIATIDGSANFTRLGAQVASAISAAVAQAAAKSAEEPQYNRLAKQFYADAGLPRNLYMPTPIVTLFSTEPKNMGKIRVREVVIIPVGATSTEAAIQRCQKVVSAAAVKVVDGDVEPVVNVDGAIRHCTYDSLPALMDLAEDCIKEAGLQPGEEVQVGIVVDACYSYRDASKYAFIEGSEMSGGQLAELLANFATDRSTCRYIEDTHHPDDVTELQRIMARVGETVTLSANNLIAGSEPALDKAVSEKLCNNMVVRLNDYGTLSAAVAGTQRFTGSFPNATITASSEQCETNSGASIVDFAVAVGARFVRIGGLLRPDHAALANRLVEVEGELEAQGILGAQPEWKSVELPPLPEAPVVELNTNEKKKKK